MRYEISMLTLLLPETCTMFSGLPSMVAIIARKLY